MECQETAGFLFKHPCSQRASEECADCGKQVCPRHLKRVEQAGVCVTCAKALLDQRVGQRPGRGSPRAHGAYEGYGNDPYFYGYAHYEGYGSYRRGQWGHDHYHSTAHDPQDFTEADGAAFAEAGDEGWEQDMGAS